MYRKQGKLSSSMKLRTLQKDIESVSVRKLYGCLFSFRGNFFDVIVTTGQRKRLHRCWKNVKMGRLGGSNHDRIDSSLSSS